MVFHTVQCEEYKTFEIHDLSAVFLSISYWDITFEEEEKIASLSINIICLYLSVIYLSIY